MSWLKDNENQINTLKETYLIVGKFHTIGNFPLIIHMLQLRKFYYPFTPVIWCSLLYNLFRIVVFLALFYVLVLHLSFLPDSCKNCVLEYLTINKNLIKKAGAFMAELKIFF